jgi:hypothetical protein
VADRKQELSAAAVEVGAVLEMAKRQPKSGIVEPLMRSAVPCRAVLFHSPCLPRCALLCFAPNTRPKSPFRA